MGCWEVDSSTRKFAGCWLCHDFRSQLEIRSIGAGYVWYAGSAYSGYIPAVGGTSWEHFVLLHAKAVSL